MENKTDGQVPGPACPACSSSGPVLFVHEIFGGEPRVVWCSECGWLLPNGRPKNKDARARCKVRLKVRGKARRRPFSC